MNNLQGQVIKGYELREKIGFGGFGEVYRAYQTVVERDVAIKIILPKHTNDPEFIRRFEFEAQMIAHLEHPYIVPLYDYWRDSDGAYLVMRWLPTNLETSLKQGQWPNNAVVRLLDQIASALTVAHRHSIIHRDIKPDNILLDEDNNAYLADFGIAKSPNYALNITRKDVIVGAPAYMSPEQIDSGTITARTDIYSLGIVLYEVLTGEKPFLGTGHVLLYKHLKETIPSVSLKRPDLPTAVDEVIHKALAKNPEDRYADVLSMATAFSQSLNTEQPLQQAILRLPIIPTVRAEPQTAIGAAITIENPYKGLRAFREADATDFFGREALVEQLIRRAAEPAHFVAVVGPSGSGKSSVVRAGLLPALRHGHLPGSDRWYIVEITPSGHPLEDLEAALLRIAINPPASLLEQLYENDRGLLRAVRRIMPDDDAQLFLVIDQFEEIFTTLEDEPTRIHFLESLVTAVSDPSSPLRIVITLRADFYDKPLLYPNFANLIRKQTEVVLPLSIEELRQAIVNPAKNVGVKLEPDLVTAIIKDVGDQPGILPMLQYVLTELFDRRDNKLLTLNAYYEIGGVIGSLARRAEEVYGSLDSIGQETAQQLFLRLITLGEGTEDTRRRVQLSELISIDTNNRQAIDGVINKFAKYRLLTLNRDPITRGPTVEVAHEALIRTWPRLHKWLTDSREELQTQRRLMTAATDWVNANFDPSFLASGIRLAQFETLVTNAKLVLNEQEHKYLHASIVERGQLISQEHERQAIELNLAQQAARSAQEAEAAHRQSAKRLRYLVSIISIFFLVSASLALFALDSRGQALYSAATATIAQGEALAAANKAGTQASIAQTNLTESESLRLAAEANGILQTVGGNVELATLLSIHALKKANLPQADAALVRAALSIYAIHIFSGHEDLVQSVTISPDGRYILTGSADKTARLWNSTTGEMIRVFSGHEDVVQSVAISPDGRFIVTGSADKTARLWNSTTGEMIRVFSGHEDAVQSVAISPDGRFIVTGSADKTARLWETETGNVIHIFSGHNGFVQGVNFSPNGHYVLTACGDADNAEALTRLWDVDTGNLLRVFEGHSAAVISAMFSPDGRYILTGSDDKTARLWNSSTGETIRVFSGHIGYVRSVAFSPDGRYILTGSDDKTARLWNSNTGEMIRVFSGHSDAVTSVVFSLNGHFMFTGSADKTLRLWNVEPDNAAQIFSGHTSDVNSVMSSSDGRYVLTSSTDKTARLWDAKTGHTIRIFSGHTDKVRNATFSPDNRYVLTSGFDQTARLWDAETGKEIRTFSGHTGQVREAVFSPDGHFVLTGSEDRTARLWDTETGNEIRTFSGHTNAIYSVAFSSDGRYIATGSSDQTVRLWSTLDGKEIRVLLGHTAMIRGVAFSLNGRYLLTASADQTARLWNIETGNLLRIFSGHTDILYKAVFSPDDRYVLTSSDDTTAKLWETGTGDLLYTFSGHTDGVVDAEFSRDGHFVLTASADKTARLWRIDLSEPIQFACNRLLRDLTLEERVQYNISEQVVTCIKLKANPTLIPLTWTPIP